MPPATNRCAIQDLQSGKEAAGIPSGVGRPGAGTVIPAGRRASTAGQPTQHMGDSVLPGQGPSRPNSHVSGSIIYTTLGGYDHAANPSVSTHSLTTQGTGAQGKTCGREPGHETCDEQVIGPLPGAFDYPSASLAPVTADTSCTSSLRCPSSTPLSTAQEGRNAVRFGIATADDDFDKILRVRWQQHLDQSPPEIALTKGWKSHYWKNWVDGLDLYDDSDVGCEVAVADDDGDDIADDHFISDVIEGYIDEDPAVEDAPLDDRKHGQNTGD